ncbi:MAG: hypothetical protein ACJAY8_000173 [Sphingobacteriales bacterium]|jgi:hypothetical protein
MRSLLSLIFLGVLPLFSIAQQKFKPTEELGFSFGGGYYLGDLNNEHFKNFDFSGGLFYRKNLDRRWSIRAGLNYVKIHAADSLSSDANAKNRNLHFQSDVFEGYAQVEFSYFPFDYDMRYGNKATPYLFLGISRIKFKPKASYQGDLYELQPLGTEGQTTTIRDQEPYDLTATSIPFGIGFRVRLSRKIALGLEGGFRYTFTDYLDDVSGKYADQGVLENEANYLTPIFADRSLEKGLPDGTNSGLDRGDPGRNDWLFISGVHIIIKLTGDKVKCPAWN